MLAHNVRSDSLWGCGGQGSLGAKARAVLCGSGTGSPGLKPVSEAPREEQTQLVSDAKGGAWLTEEPHHGDMTG